MQKGFTLIELMASIAVFTVLFGIIMAHHARFGGAVRLNNLAYDMALSIRQAQIYGLSVKEFEVGTGEFHDGYGVYFNASTPTSYVLFADRGIPANLTYDENPPCGTLGSECIESFTIRGGNRIEDVCGVLSGGTEHCFSTGQIQYLNIIFLRPEPDAIVTSNVPASYAFARVSVVSPEGVKQDIITRVTGQISVGD